MIFWSSDGLQTAPKWTKYGLRYGEWDGIWARRSSGWGQGPRSLTYPFKNPKGTPKRGRSLCPCLKALPPPQKSKLLFLKRRGKVVFTKSGISRPSMVQIQNFLYQKKDLFKIYNFVEEVELKF